MHKVSSNLLPVLTHVGEQLQALNFYSIFKLAATMIWQGEEDEKTGGWQLQEQVVE